MEAVNTYNHHSPTNRIEFIEEDIEREHNDAIALCKKGVLCAQSSLALFRREFDELSLGCSNNDRNAIERRHKKRLAAAKVALDAAIHASRSAREEAEILYEAAVRLAGREQADDEWNDRLTIAKADKKAALRRCKLDLKAAQKTYSCNKLGRRGAKCQSFQGSTGYLQELERRRVSAGSCPLKC